MDALPNEGDRPMTIRILTVAAAALFVVQAGAANASLATDAGTQVSATHSVASGAVTMTGTGLDGATLGLFADAAEIEHVETAFTVPRIPGVGRVGRAIGELTGTRNRNRGQVEQRRPRADARSPRVRDHRTGPVVRDHRTPARQHERIPAQRGQAAQSTRQRSGPVVRDHRNRAQLQQDRTR
jgi:hypothetical protein